MHLQISFAFATSHVLASLWPVSCGHDCNGGAVDGLAASSSLVIFPGAPNLWRMSLHQHRRAARSVADSVSALFSWALVRLLIPSPWGVPSGLLPLWFYPAADIYIFLPAQSLIPDLVGLE